MMLQPVQVLWMWMVQVNIHSYHQRAEICYLSLNHLVYNLFLVQHIKIHTVPIILYATALLIPSSSAPYYFTAYLGPFAGSLQSVLQAVTPSGGQHSYPITLKVPASWYYSFSFTGTGTGASGGWDGKVCVYHDK